MLYIHLVLIPQPNPRLCQILKPDSLTLAGQLSIDNGGVIDTDLGIDGGGISSNGNEAAGGSSSQNDNGSGGNIVDTTATDINNSDAAEISASGTVTNGGSTNGILRLIHATVILNELHVFRASNCINSSHSLDI